MREVELNDVLLLQEKFKEIEPYLNERSLRIWCATEADTYNKTFGSGGNTVVHRATGVSYPTIRAGLSELREKDKKEISRVRQKGGGRKKVTDRYPNILHDLELLVEPLSRGDPESALRWTCKSVRNLAEELQAKNYSVSFRTICDLLESLDYSLQGNKKTKEGSSHPDRDKQFRYINKAVKVFQKERCPVISVDAKKKENIGEYKNNGKEYCPKGAPVKVNTYDFPNKILGKAAPYGVYDLVQNKGWVSVGISSDTAEFAVNTIREWWKRSGKKEYSTSSKILITADCGGSNGYKNRLWKWELQQFANAIKKEIHVCHFPPGTSKWNKIEHRLFSFITMNWRGKPLTDLETIVNLIGHTKTKTGLTVDVVVDKNQYEKGRKISDDDFQSIKLKMKIFHGEWNYVIKPKKA